MHQINRSIFNISSDQLEASKVFYTTLFAFEVAFDSDWYINLRHADPPVEIGLLHSNSDLIPDDYPRKNSGGYLTFVVEDVDQVHQLALEKGFRVKQAPEDTFYGQRRMLLLDPNDFLIDVSSLIPARN